LHASHSKSSLVETFLSSDAYMLMYHLKHTKNVGEIGSVICGPKHDEREGVEVALQNGASLASHLCNEFKISMPHMMKLVRSTITRKSWNWVVLLEGDRRFDLF